MTVHTKSAVGARVDEPEAYDFDRPTTLGRDHVRLLRGALESFARQWQTQLTTRLRAVCRITVGDIHLATYDEYVETLPATTVMVLCGVDPLQARAIMQFPVQSSLRWITRMVGSDSESTVPDRELTIIEQAIMRSIVADALDVLHYTMGDSFPSEFKVETVRFGARTAQAAATTDSMIVIEFRIAVGETSAAVTFAVPAEALSDEIAPLPAEERAHVGDLMAEQLSEVPVRVALRFQPTPVSSQIVLGLAEGDVIRLGHSKNKPLSVVVEGQTLARAAVGASGAQLACVIVDTREGS